MSLIRDGKAVFFISVFFIVSLLCIQLSVIGNSVQVPFRFSQEMRRTLFAFDLHPFSSEGFNEIQTVVSADVFLEQSIESSRTSVDSDSIPNKVEEIQNQSSLIPHHQVEEQVIVSEKSSQIVNEQVKNQVTASEGPQNNQEGTEDQMTGTKKLSRSRKSLWKRKRGTTRSVTTTPTTAVPERDHHLSKFGKRFRLSNRSIQMRKLENPNTTYFPKDHVSDGHIYNLRKALAEEEGYIMEDQYPFYSQYMESYTSFSRYLSTRHIYFKKYWTEEERSTFQKLNSERRERYRHHMLKKYEDYYVADEKERKHKREALMKKYQRVSNGMCEGCRYLGLKDYPISLHYYGRTRKFKGNEEVFTIYNSTHYVYPSPDTPFSISGVCVTTLDRLVLLPQLLYRWEGPLVLVINGPAHREGEMITYINSHYLPSRLTVILYLIPTQEKVAFPVNMLRNLAIRNIETTHYQILDMDLMPTTNTYSEMMKLPVSLRSGNNAVILPVFFYDRKAMLARCTDLSSCALLSLEADPQNKLELEACLQSKVCLASKPGIRTHIYIMPEWYGNMTSPISRIRCFTADFQEPYVLLRYHKTTPLFDERFVNYGYNKVQLFEHLRSAGFRFYIWNHCFAMDLPHPDSSLRKAYIDEIKGETSEMRELYKDFQAELNEKYRNVNPSRICYSLQKRYFVEVHCHVFFTNVPL